MKPRVFTLLHRIILFGILISPNLCWGNTEIDLHTNLKTRFQTLQYSDPVRLHQALTQALKARSQKDPTQGTLFWTGTALINLNKPLAQQKAQLIKELKQLQITLPPHQRVSIELVIFTLTNLPQGERVPISTDLDFVLGNPKADPLLEGHYALYLPNRPTHIRVFGALNATSNHSWQPRKSAKYYLQEAEFWYAIDTIIVIHPDGHLEQHPIAYWNHHHHDIAPGALIFVPFPKGLTDNTQQLNKRIVRLLQHRVL